MVANAWYPIHYFRLSFGKNDSLFDIVTELQKETQIPIDASCEEVIGQLQERLRDKQVDWVSLLRMCLTVFCIPG